MNDRDPDSACEPAALHRGARTARMVLIEPRTPFRQLLATVLTSSLPGLLVEGVKSPDEVAPGPARLLVIGPDPLSGRQRWRLRETIETLRRLGDGSPIGAYLHAQDMRVAVSLTRFGVVGIVMSDASMAAAVAYLRFMVAGGAFLTPELVDRRQDGVLARARAEDLPSSEVAPTALAHSDESRSPYRNLTARERDVFRSMSAGHTNKRIALELQISEGTVKVHLHSIMRKLHATNRTQAAVQFGASAAAMTSS